MKFKELYYFTGQCLALDSHPDFRDTIIYNFSTDEFPFEKFFWICDVHLIMPTIYLKLRNHNLLNHLPNELSNHLEFIYSLNKKRNLEIIQQISHINSILKHENIFPVYLKGTANLFDNLYSDPGERLINDIDLLVEESDYTKTIDTIIRLGYKFETKNVFGIEEQKHFYPLCKDDVPAAVEIHKVPVDISHSKQFTTEMIFADREIAQKEKNSYVPSIEHRIIHNFIHGQLDHKGHWRKSNTLRDLYDLYLLSKQNCLTPLLAKVEAKNKFISYIVFSDKVFDLKNSLYPDNSIRTKLYCLISEFFLNHGRLYGINQFFILIFEKISLLFNYKLYRKQLYSKVKSEGISRLLRKL